MGKWRIKRKVWVLWLISTLKKLKFLYFKIFASNWVFLFFFFILVSQNRCGQCSSGSSQTVILSKLEYRVTAVWLRSLHAIDGKKYDFPHYFSTAVRLWISLWKCRNPSTNLDGSRRAKTTMETWGRKWRLMCENRENPSAWNENTPVKTTEKTFIA